MPQIFGHKNDGNRGNDAHGANFENRAGECGQAEPRRACYTAEIHWGTETHAVSQNPIQKTSQKQATQNKQPLRNPAGIDRYAAHA